MASIGYVARTYDSRSSDHAEKNPSYDENDHSSSREANSDRFRATTEGEKSGEENSNHDDQKNEHGEPSENSETVLFVLKCV